MAVPTGSNLGTKDDTWPEERSSQFSHCCAHASRHPPHHFFNHTVDHSTTLARQLGGPRFSGENHTVI